jgi:hypothetical protein
MKNILRAPTWVFVMSGIFLLVVEIFIVIPANNPLLISTVGTLAIGLMIAGSILNISRCNQAIKELKEKQVDKKEKGHLI